MPVSLRTARACCFCGPEIKKRGKTISNCPKICLLLSSIETSQCLLQPASMSGRNDKTTEDSFRTSGNILALKQVRYFMSKKHRVAFCDRIMPPSVSITPSVPTATAIKSNTIFFCLQKKARDTTANWHKQAPHHLYLPPHPPADLLTLIFAKYFVVLPALSLFQTSDIIVLECGIIRAWGLEGPNRWKWDQAPALWTHLVETRGMILDCEPVAKMKGG